MCLRLKKTREVLVWLELFSLINKRVTQNLFVQLLHLNKNYSRRSIKHTKSSVCVKFILNNLLRDTQDNEMKMSRRGSNLATADNRERTRRFWATDGNRMLDVLRYHIHIVIFSLVERPSLKLRERTSLKFWERPCPAMRNVNFRFLSVFKKRLKVGEHVNLKGILRGLKKEEKKENFVWNTNRHFLPT